MPMAHVNYLDIHYELHGQGDPLVLIAGYGCDLTFWSAMLDELAAHFQVLIFDNRGVGQTKDNGEPFTLETMAEDALALICQLGLRQPKVLGQSMGGAIAQIMARRSNIEKLAILNSAAKFSVKTLTAVGSLLALRQQGVALELLLEASMPWFLGSAYLSSPQNVAAFKRGWAEHPYPQTLADQARQFNALFDFDSRAWLHEIKIPTLVIAAEEDIVNLPVESQLIAHKIAGSTFERIPGGHSSPVEQPREVNRALLRFFSGVAT